MDIPERRHCNNKVIKMWKLFEICLLLMLSFVSCKKHDMSRVDELRHELLQQGEIIEHDLSRNSWLDDNGDQHMYLIKRYKEFGDKMDQIFPTNRQQHLDALNSLWIWAMTQTEITGIEGLYMIFRQMQRETIAQATPLNIEQLRQFSLTILHDPNASIPFALERIADYIVLQKLFISANQEASAHSCNKQQSAQQLLFNLYTTVALTEIKGYAMIQFSYGILRLYENGTTYNEEINSLKQQYAERTYNTLRAVKTAMTFAPRDLWMCDPDKHVLDQTYTELKQVFQGYIVNEVDLNTENTCKENCAYYSYAKVRGCFKNEYCAQQRMCSGKVVNCEYIDSDMWICPSKRNGYRRYEYIEYENGKIFGVKDTCRNPTIKVDSWWRWLFWHCSYCFCYCDDHNVHSERYFNLRSVESDVKNNKIITGLKFVKNKQIIHIQIQEGVLLPNGGINQSTITWKPVDDYSVTDRNVDNGIDYHTMLWEKRAIDMDDLVAPVDCLLTGVRFRTVGSRLNFEIKVSSFNFTTGKLIKPELKSQWVSNDETERTELKLEKPDIPIHSTLKSGSDTKINQYLNFRASDRDKDAAQSTVPFIDIQAVVPNPFIPLSGAGIYHKGTSGSGGFLALKLITFDFGPYLKADVPPAKPLIETPNDITSN